ncbi:MAG: hypothetical protein KDA96_11490 [Planctomycetaceae bacterium]|nr:hypothetical protein [Planctomycetaceae bacterium]
MNDKIHLTTNPPRQRRLSRAWCMLILFDVCVFALAYGQDSHPASAVQTQTTESASETDAPQPQKVSVVTQVDGPADVADDAERFEAIDIYVDSGDVPLAAYQFEVAGTDDRVTIAAIEGGQHPAFSDPPHYDPRAMKMNRAVLAAFHTGDNLPSGQTRLARVHVLVRGPGVTEYRATLTASADAAGKRIPATLAIRKAGG